MKRRVVITGAGVITSIGVGIKEFWQNCLKGKSVIEKIPKKWEQYSNYHSHYISPLPSFDYKSYLVDDVENMQYDPYSLMGICCTKEALDNAGLECKLVNKRTNKYCISGIDSTRSGVFIGTGAAPYHSITNFLSWQLFSRPTKIINQYKELHTLQELMKHPRRPNPFTATMVLHDSCASNIGIKFSLKGINETLSLACASGTAAIGKAFHAIAYNKADIAIAGGSEYLHDDFGATFLTFDMTGTLMKDCDNLLTGNCPFDKNRSGFLFSDGGAAILIIEELQHAQNRGANIIGEIIGYGEIFSDYGQMLLDPTGNAILEVIDKTLHDASLNYSDIDYINAHGTGTITNDEIESLVLEKNFDKQIINSTKSLVGHTIGACGAIEALVSVLSIKDQTTHICKNLKNPIRSLNFVTSVKPYDIRVAYSHSFAFGGHHSGLIFKRYEK